MHKKNRLATACMLCLFVLGSVFSQKNNPPEIPAPPDREQSLAAFQTILTVLRHPRCLNCHPNGDRPRQGDDQRIHILNVQRGEDDRNGPVQKCQTCHHAQNNAYSNVPGAPHWALAPRSMAWFGLSDAEIGRRFVDPEMNGGRTPADLAKHMTEDSLVLWAWDPGKGRELPPVDLPTWKRTVETWLAAGAFVPDEQ